MKTHPELPEWLGAYYKENPEDDLFDLSIYDRNSKLNCVECSKGYKLMGKGKPTVQDWRVLIPRPQSADEPKESFLIQYLTENDQRAVASDGTIEKELLEARNQAIKSRSGNKRQKLSDTNLLCEEVIATKIKTALPELASVSFGAAKQFESGVICVPVLSDSCVICKRLHHGSKTCVIVTGETAIYKCRSDRSVVIKRSLTIKKASSPFYRDEDNADCSFDLEKACDLFDASAFQENDTRSPALTKYLNNYMAIVISGEGKPLVATRKTRDHKWKLSDFDASKTSHGAHVLSGYYTTA